MLSCLAVCAPVRGEVSESQRLLDDLLGNLIELLPVIAPHFGRIHVSSTFVIGLCQHAHHRQQDLLHALHWTPPLRTALVAHGVVAWRVEDGNADSPIRVDCKGQRQSGEPRNGAQGVTALGQAPQIMRTRITDTATKLFAQLGHSLGPLSVMLHVCRNPGGASSLTDRLQADLASSNQL